MSDIRITDWAVETTGTVDDFCETVFFTGNGYLGVRGFPGWQGKEKPQDHAVFKAGLFSHITPKITDMVQLPDVLTLCPAGHAPAAVKQTLNLKNGVVTQEWEDGQFRFALKRAVSMADPSLMLARLTVQAKEYGHLIVQAAADAAVANLPVHDDQTVENTELTQLLELVSLSETAMTLRTLYENTPVRIGWRVTGTENAENRSFIQGTKAVTELSRTLSPGEAWIVEKRVRVFTGGEQEREEPSGDLWAANEAAWDALWADCDLTLESDDPELQGAVRYNIFQMLANNAAATPKASIGARGLTHGRYKGNTFWDTDIFLFPFYLWTRPEAAKNLMLYRAERLEDAKALAKRQNLDGARFPWMCSDTGMEQCESWDIGLCEVHITADVAYAMNRYCTVTGDAGFRKELADPIFLETGRYWLSRLTWEQAKNRYSSFFVKGPDEYCGAAVNNTYTNWMARNNLRLALESGLAGAEESERLRHAVEHITLLYDAERKLYLQDELFERLEPMDPTLINDMPSYRSVCFDRVQRYRVLKQADLVLLVTLFPDGFSDEEKRSIFETYEPLTLHDSTLSWGVHALLALRLGLWDKAEAYLKKGVYLDLKDLMGNTGREGVHMAALGAAWQALVYGAAGLWADEKGLTLNPMLPKGIHRMMFSVYYHGERYRVLVSENEAKLEREAK